MNNEMIFQNSKMRLFLEVTNEKKGLAEKLTLILLKSLLSPSRSERYQDIIFYTPYSYLDRHLNHQNHLERLSDTIETPC